MPDLTRKNAVTAEVCLLIRTHALPVLSYVVPERFWDEIWVGSVVVVPLSSGSHPGVVVAVGGPDERASQSVISVSRDLALTKETVEVCELVAEDSSVALASVLRTALPPKVITTRYRISSSPGYWKEGALVERRVLKSRLGEAGFREIERSGGVERVVLAPTIPTEEWVVATKNPTPDFGRAKRQREVYERLLELDGEATVETLAASDGTPTSKLRPLLRSLADRSAVTLEDRDVIRAIKVSENPDTTSPKPLEDIEEGTRVALSGGAGIWRVPTGRTSSVVDSLARTVNGSGKSLLVIAPETAWVEEIASDLGSSLDGGRRVGVYHSRLEDERAAVWRAARAGELDVLVGTRSAATIPLSNLGAICVVDEPNPSHRASPGHEGIPIHVREIAKITGEVHDVPTVLLSPRPSLRSYASVLHPDLKISGRPLTEIPELPDDSWPSVRMVDMRGTGSSLSSTLLETCEDFLDDGKRIAVVANRLGHTAVVCGGCGGVRSCPDCDVPFILREAFKDVGRLVCGRCGYEEDLQPSCPECGSMRYSKARPSVDSIRRNLTHELDVPVGLLTATRRRRTNANVVVGTAAPLLVGGREKHDLVVLPDADSLLLASWMGSTERAFASIFSAAESAREMLLVQTTNPENHTLRSAVRGDYRAFAAAELPRLEELGYPPYAHLASFDFEGRRDEVAAAVESRLLPHVEPGVVPSGLVPGASGGFRILLRSPDRAALILTTNRAARALSRLPARKRARVSIVIDPEEV